MNRTVWRGSSLRMVIALSCLAISGLACNLTWGAPTPPASPIPVSTEAVGELAELWKSAIENSINGEVTVTVTEVQLTSLAALRLADNPDAVLTDPQIFLRDGKIQIYGTARAGAVTAPALIVLALNITADGQVEPAIEQANFGPLPVPDSLLETISAALNEALTGQIGSQATGIRITNAAVTDGQLTLTGTINQ